jgi:hypothetical protein
MRGAWNASMHEDITRETSSERAIANDIEQDWHTGRRQGGRAVGRIDVNESTRGR